MANPHRGETAFDVGGKTYTLRFSANAICELEEQLDRSFLAISSDLEKIQEDPNRIRFGTLRAIFWAGLHEHHPELDIKAAGDLMIEMGGVIKAMEMISEGFTRAFPAAGSKDARPPVEVKPAPNGTGLAS